MSKDSDMLQGIFNAWLECGYPSAKNPTDVFVCGYQAATAAAEAKYLPVIEKLVKKLRQIRSANEGDSVRTYQEMERIADEALALAAPLLKGEK